MQQFQVAIYLEKSLRQASLSIYWKTAEWIDIIGEYHVTVPQGHWESKGLQPYQMLYNLHGSGGTGRRIHPFRRDHKPDHYDELEHASTPYLRILPWTSTLSMGP